jgi:PST family polysaccharide transporter
VTVVATSTLRQRAVRGAAWTLPTSIGSRAVGLFGTLLLARYLAPNEYGAVMAASIAATTASSVTTFGVGIYLVANADVSRAEAFHASCWFLVTGVAALTATMMIGGPLGRWSGAPGLAAFLPLLILSTLFERVVYVPEKILVRNLRFGWLSLARALGELTFTGVSVALAAQGAGAMAIAWGSLARSVFRFAAIVPVVDIREWLEPHRLRPATLRKIVGYGMNVTVASIATFGMRRWDNLLVSRYFGMAAMGAYNYAYNLADTPANAIGDQMSDVVAASFPHVDQRRRAEALVEACAMVSMIMFPLSIGLAVVAPTVVDTFFDQKWSNVGTMLTLLSALSVARPIAGILSSYFYASRRPSVVLWLEWLSLAGVIATISSVGRVGVNWACASVGVVFVLRTLAGLWMVRRQDGVPLAEFLLPMARPLAACLAMAAGVSAARPAIAGFAAPLRLLIEIALGAAIYIGGALLVARSGCTDLRASAPRSRRRHDAGELDRERGQPEGAQLEHRIPESFGAAEGAVRPFAARGDCVASAAVRRRPDRLAGLRQPRARSTGGASHSAGAGRRRPARCAPSLALSALRRLGERPLPVRAPAAGAGQAPIAAPVRGHRCAFRSSRRYRRGSDRPGPRDSRPGDDSRRRAAISSSAGEAFLDVLGAPPRRSGHRRVRWPSRSGDRPGRRPAPREDRAERHQRRCLLSPRPPGEPLRTPPRSGRPRHSLRRRPCGTERASPGHCGAQAPE